MGPRGGSPTLPPSPLPAMPEFSDDNQAPPYYLLLGVYLGVCMIMKNRKG
jgi:hypothetical protein